VIGPLVFAIYISPISNVVTAHSLDHHQYADDKQLYMAVRPSADVTSQQSRSVLKTSLAGSLRTGCFSTQPRRRQFCSGLRPSEIRYCLRAALTSRTVDVVPFHDSVKLLGVTLDSVLTMDRHVTEVIRSCSYHTRALRHIRPLLTLDVAKIIGHSIVSSLLNYTPTHCCNVGLQHQQAASGAKFVGQDSLSSPSVSTELRP